MPDILNVNFSYLPVLNFAMQQNRVSFIREFSVENISDKELQNIRVELTCEPDFAYSVPFHIEKIKTYSTFRIDATLLNLSPKYFAQLTEREAAQLTLKISDSDGGLLFNKQYPIDILAYDQWGGISVLPEILSAFITPNHPAIAPIIQRATIILQQWTNSASLDEYQSRNPDRVRKQMAAIYTAIAEQDIIYSTVPASFEEYGQRVRLVDTILAQKLGTCLDMALLYASCLESIGIHPLILITNGHAFAGAWLVPDTFPDAVIDDSASITKRTADGINEITLVETTCMNMGKNMDFDSAVRSANSKISNQSDFVLAIDVKRTRFSGIRPMPQRILNGLEYEIEGDEDGNKTYSAPESVSPYDLSGINEEIVVTKQLLWERKLLDLSLRNNLLNIRITKNTLQLISTDLHLFEDALSENSEFKILAKPNDWDNPLYNFGLYQSIAKDDPIIDLVKSELTQNRLRAYLDEKDLPQALTHLYRSSRTSMEENGANTLYMALGLLEWYETPTSERPRYAPILLQPVEIIRKSASKGYIIRSREEETMLNITLLEMLRQNFGINVKGLTPLPTDESGLDVKLIFSIVRNSIKDQRKWDVKDQAILGIFSFNKFIMWNDIHNNAQKLKENKIVSSLMNGKIEWDIPHEEPADAAVLEKELTPADILLPIGADSSQFEAIYEASKGKTFILHGPPGTGKSQTITNIIANSLYRGKRVLFVAEKMAALSVVENRLTALGLSPFCLELYSNKTKKTAIINQLKEATEVVKTKSSEEFHKESDRLFALRHEINVYIEALHKTQPFGLSLYDAITSYLLNDEKLETIIPQSLLNGLTKERTQEWEDALNSLVTVAQVCGHPHNHPLTGIAIPEYSANIKEDSIKLLTNTSKLLNTIKDKLRSFAVLMGDETAQYNKKDIETLSAIVEKILFIPELTPTLITTPQLHEALQEYKEIIPHGKKRDELKNKVTKQFSDKILEINGADSLLNSWDEGTSRWFLPRLIGQGKVRKQLKTYSKSGKVDTLIIRDTLEFIVDYQREVQYLDNRINQFPALFGKYGKKEIEDWNNIEQIVNDTSILNNLILHYAQDVAKSARIKTHLANQLNEGVSSFKAIYGPSLNETTALLNQLNDNEHELISQLGINIDLFYTESADWIDVARNQIAYWLENMDLLKDWYQWLTAYRKVDSLNIGFIGEFYVKENIPTDHIKEIFFKSFHKTVITYILNNESHLDLFKGKLFEDVINRYRELNTKFEQLTRKEIYSKLASNIPDFTREATHNSEVGILQRNIRNNARGTSIRRLFDQIPILLSRICPCMMMSPISVAQYIDPDADKFDLVIFDEASQVPTYEAVGAIARGKSIVIVGDPKQMPPTNFFTTNTVDEENIEIEDLESILDDCLALSIPSKYLLWHYRSKHESLIAFSNSEYYDNKLYTFPSPDNIDSKVKLIPIKGHYDKGKSRQNRFEAQAVINEIERRLRDTELRKRSIGVVTFSIVQQSLIEDMLSNLFIQHPDLEALALGGEEPIFIKNLENVQGDERDVILFSIGYGPDKDGRVSMNFGPLNRLGGERRLNVAVSRARYEMLIFSTLSSEQIDLNRTSSIGVAGLKRFLDYAERNKLVNFGKSASAPETYNHIENLIAKDLEKQGYIVHTNIGSSGYQIDIAIVDPKNPSKYILGILCDGDSYQQSKTTRDREIVQSSVLKLLGWDIMRVWTMDWWANSNEVIASIKTKIEELKEGKNQVVEKKQTQTLLVDDEIISDKTNKAQSINSKVEKSENGMQNYISTTLKSVSATAAEDIYSLKNQKLIIQQMNSVIKSEAPISQNLLFKRVLSAWNGVRMTQKLDAYFEILLNQCSQFKTQHDNLIFFWTDQEQYKTYDLFRVNFERDAQDLPPEEVANAMKFLLANELSMPIADLAHLTAQQFGFLRSGSNVDAAMSRGLGSAIEKGFIKTENSRAIIC